MDDRVLIHVIDDDAAVRDALAFLLDVHGYEVASYASAPEFLAALPCQSIRCIVTDVRMPRMSGLELVRELKARGVSAPVVVMTGHGDIPLAVEAMRAGVSDFIEKPFDDAVLLKAVSNALASAEAGSTVGGDEEARRLIATLSPREHDVLLGVVAGKQNKLIGHELDISPRTVEIYRANLMTKTGARTVADLMRLAFRAGL
jgi:two-component system response regulator FixJ